MEGNGILPMAPQAALLDHRQFAELFLASVKLLAPLFDGAFRCSFLNGILMADDGHYLVKLAEGGTVKM